MRKHLAVFFGGATGSGLRHGFLLVLALLFFGQGEAWAGNPDGALRIEIIAAPNFVVDSNVGTPASYGPRSAFIGAKFYNDGATNLTNVFAYIGNYISASSNTPGLYPQRTQAPLVGPLAGGAFALTHEGGSAGLRDATRYLGTIQPGEYVAVYWLVSYPLLDQNNTPVFQSGPNPGDDLWLQYWIWGQAMESGAARTAAQVNTATLRNEISASANKIYPNTANKVPEAYQELLQKYAPAWTNIASDGSPGTLITTEGFWYDLGLVGDGYDADGDLVPDHDLWMQPVGDPALFDAGSFRLVRSRVLIVVKLKSGGEQVYTELDRLYFKDIPPNNGAVGFVGYDFMALRGSSQSQLTPYQEVASGSNNEKFNGDYGSSIVPPLVSLPADVTLAKNTTASAVSPGSTIPYTVAFTNEGAVSLGDPALAMGLVVQDHIPAGTHFVAGSAGVSNVPPAGVSGYTILYSTNNGVAWTAAEPAATNVTDIQWWINDPMPTGTVGLVRFSVRADNPYQPASPLVVNTAGLSFGYAVPFLTAQANTLIMGTNWLSGVVFADTGSGGGFGNQIRDGAEAGISSITVRLYFDANSNSTVDAADVLLATTVSATNGAYSFLNLMDGRFLSVVDTADPDLPFGYTITTPDRYGVDLDAAQVTPNPVTYTNADFGFAPALQVQKTLVGLGPLYEGRYVTYVLDIMNRLPGTGTSAGVPVSNDVWAALYDSGSGSPWINATNLYIPPGPDGRYARAPLGSQPDVIAVTDFHMTPIAGSITNVVLLFPVLNVPGTGDPLLQIEVYRRGGAQTYLATTNIHVTQMPLAGTWVFALSNLTGITWADFNSSNLIIRITCDKNGGNPTFQVNVDATGFRVMTDQVTGGASGATTLNPVPLSDRYAVNLLQFVAALPPQTSVTTNGAVGTVFWNNLGPIYPGGSNRVSVTFKVLEPPTNTATMATNTASVTNAFFGNGRPANPASSEVATNLLPTGVIGDYVWRDLNRDGNQGSNEVGIANVRIALLPPATVDLGAGPGVGLTNLTDRNGFYLFEGIPATGRYVVIVFTNSLPNSGVGATNTYSEMNGTVNPTNVTVVTNLFPAATNGLDKHLTADFGYFLGTTIDGLIWNDLNRDGAASPALGEPWLTNVTVYLYSNAMAIATTRTDLTGYYSFTGNYTGTYAVVVATNLGPFTSATWIAAFDTDGLATSNRVTVSVEYGAVAHADFSYYRIGPYALGRTVYYDWNGNGSQGANEEGIPAIPVYLFYDANTNGIIDPGVDVLMATTATDTGGNYLFTNYPSGAFVVVVDQTVTQFPAFYFCTADPFGALDGRSLAAITNASRYDQNFGYQPYGFGSIGTSVWFDANGDGLQSGLLEVGLSNILVSLYVDMNNDGNYVLLTTTNTDSRGQYLFAGLPDGNYRVTVNAADADLPRDAFNNVYVPTTATNIAATITGGSAFIGANFGFSALGAIGNTIFWDFNGNGQMDWNEPGTSNVTVQLYRDADGNGIYDPGETLVVSRLTDTNGTYIFSGLATGAYVVVVVSNSPPIANARLTSDPNADGVPAYLTNGIAADGQCGVVVRPGTSFMGANFGYQPPGVIGGLLWIDFNTNQVPDSSELGIPNIPVELWSNGTLVATTTADPDGYYAFGNLIDGVYRVVVRTNDAAFPAGLAPDYDPDGTNDSQATSIVLAGGHIVSLGGTARTNFDLSVNFGYRFSGTNVLSGTVGLDAAPYNGVLGTGASGVAANEAAFGGETVYLYLWRDTDSNNVIDGGEAVLIAGAVTATNGDYTFTDLPDGSGPATNRYVVSLAAPMAHLALTTTNGATPALWVSQTTNAFGENLSAYQVVAIRPVVTNIDFAYRSTWLYDFGDLPRTYSTLLADTPDGARHRVLGVPDLYLGTNVNTETDGQPATGADADSFDDGATALGVWQTGASGGVVRVKVGAGSGWLCGYLDFNTNGTFVDTGEMVLSQAVATNGGNGTGVYTVAVSVPANVIKLAGVTALYARFRLFPSEPTFPACDQGYKAGGLSASGFSRASRHSPRWRIAVRRMTAKSRTIAGCSARSAILSGTIRTTTVCGRLRNRPSPACGCSPT
jgi:uncharacterized repeat protein (TIGR01451 family)